MPNPPRLDVRMGVGNVRVPSARRLSVRTSDLRAVSGDFSGDFPATAKMTVLPLIFFFALVRSWPGFVCLPVALLIFIRRVAGKIDVSGANERSAYEW